MSSADPVLTVDIAERVCARLLAPVIPDAWRVVLHTDPADLTPDTVAVTIEESVPPDGYDPPLPNVLRHAIAVTVYGDRAEAVEELAATIQRTLLNADVAAWREAAEAVAQDYVGDPLDVLWIEAGDNRTSSDYTGAAAALTVHHAIVTGSLVEEDIQ